MIDIHQHLLFGIDDGAADEKEARAMIDACAKQGIETVVATPHVWLGAERFPRESVQAVMRQILPYAESRGVKLLAGAEILISGVLLDSLEKRDLPVLGSSNLLLLEFLPETYYPTMLSAVREMIARGYRPVLAHMERYDCLYRHPERVESLRNLGAVMQMNAHFVKRLHRFGARRFYYRLIKTGNIDCIASDAHNCSSRPQLMLDAYNKLKIMFGRETADRLTRENIQALLLQNEN